MVGSDSILDWGRRCRRLAYQGPRVFDPRQEIYDWDRLMETIDTICGILQPLIDDGVRPTITTNGSITCLIFVFQHLAMTKRRELDHPKVAKQFWSGMVLKIQNHKISILLLKSIGSQFF